MSGRGFCLFRGRIRETNGQRYTDRHRRGKRRDDLVPKGLLISDGLGRGVGLSFHYVGGLHALHVPPGAFRAEPSIQRRSARHVPTGDGGYAFQAISAGLDRPIRGWELFRDAGDLHPPGVHAELDTVRPQVQMPLPWKRQEKASHKTPYLY